MRTNEHPRSLTKRQADITTLELAWWYWLGDSPAPNLPRVCGWLTKVPEALLVELVERAASESAKRPQSWIYDQIKQIEGNGNHGNN